VDLEKRSFGSLQCILSRVRMAAGSSQGSRGLHAQAPQLCLCNDALYLGIALSPEAGADRLKGQLQANGCLRVRLVYDGCQVRRHRQRAHVRQRPGGLGAQPERLLVLPVLRCFPGAV